MGGGSSTTKTRTQNKTVNSPPEWTAGGLADVAGRVQNAVGQIPTQHYSGQQIAFMTPQELAAIQGAWEGTAQNAVGLSDWMQSLLPQLTQGPQFNIEGGPAISAFDMGSMHDMDPVIQAAIHPVREQLMNEILPGIKTSSLEAGAYSGDRAMRVLPGEALDAASESMQRIAAELGYENYRDFENRRLQAWQSGQGNILDAYGLDTQRGLGTSADATQRMSLIPSYVNDILRNQATSGDLLRMAAELGVNTNQARISDSLARDAYASQSPFMGLDSAASLLTALSGNWGTQDFTGYQKTKTSQDPGAMDYLKAGIGAASMIAGFPGIGLGGAAAAGMGAGSGFGALNASSLFGGAPNLAASAPTVFNPFMGWPGG